MTSEEELARAIMEAISRLPSDQQHDAILDAVNQAASTLTLDSLIECRADVAKLLEDEPLQIVSDALDLLDGKIAIKEMGL